MLRLQPSEISLTRGEVAAFLNRPPARRMSASTFVYSQLSWTSPMLAASIPTFRQGAERSRDDSLTDYELDSSPSAALSDYDRLYGSGDDAVIGSTEADISSTAQYTPEPLDVIVPLFEEDQGRRDLVLSQVPYSATLRKSPRWMLPDIADTAQLDGPSPSRPRDAYGRRDEPGDYPSLDNFDLPAGRRYRPRSTSDPSDPTPFFVERYRPSPGLSRALTMNDLSNLISSVQSVRENPRVTSFAIDEHEHNSRHHDATVAIHAIRYHQSPLDELVASASRLNIQRSEDEIRATPSVNIRFPSFDDSHSRSASFDSNFSTELSASPSTFRPDSPGRPYALQAADDTIRSPTAATPSPTTPSAADRLRAFADTFSSQLTPRATLRQSLTPFRDSTAPSIAPISPTHTPDWSNTASPSRQFSAFPSRQPLPRLSELAIARGGRPVIGSPLHRSAASMSRRNLTTEEQENDDDTSEVEAVARAWRARVDERTPPSVGRYLRFMR